MKLRSTVGCFLLLFSMASLSGCKTTSISDLTQDDGLARIKKSYSDKEWSEVINEVDEYKTRYPYSKFMKEADLMQGDSYYSLGRYPETIAVYENFIRKNPSDKNVALANYRIAKCFDAQAPNNYDRDQSNSKRALEKYNFFIQNFASSEWVTEASQRRDILNRRIANHSNFVAEFYWNKDLYAAALSRYLFILKSYPEYKDLIQNAKQRASDCYLKLANFLEKNPSSDTYVYFKNETPDSLKKKAEEIRQ